MTRKRTGPAVGSSTGRPAIAAILLAALTAGCIGTSENYSLIISEEGDAEVLWERVVDLEKVIDVLEDSVRSTMSESQVPSEIRFEMENVFRGEARAAMISSAIESAEYGADSCADLGRISIGADGEEGGGVELPVTWASTFPEFTANGPSIEFVCRGKLTADELESAGFGTPGKNGFAFEFERQPSGADDIKTLSDAAFADLRDELTFWRLSPPGIYEDLDSLLLRCENSDLSACLELMEILTDEAGWEAEFLILSQSGFSDFELEMILEAVMEYSERAAVATFYSILVASQDRLTESMASGYDAGEWQFSVTAPGKARTSSGTLHELEGSTRVSWVVPYVGDVFAVDADWSGRGILRMALISLAAIAALAGLAAASVRIRSRRRPEPASAGPSAWGSDERSANIPNPVRERTVYPDSRPYGDFGTDADPGIRGDGPAGGWGSVMGDREAEAPVPLPPEPEPKKTEGPPAGWYKDPAAGSTGQRYWDGTAWTGNVRPLDPGPQAWPQQ